MIDPDGLLRHAVELAGTGRGRPPDANLRRGVSACYYAVFHDLTSLAVDHVVAAADAEVKAQIRRSWTHTELVRSCEQISARAQVLHHNPHAPLSKEHADAGPLIDLAASDADAAEACRLFVELYAQRLSADYDHLETFDKARLVSARGDAVEVRQRLRSAAPEARQAMLTLLVLRRSDFRPRS